MTKGIFAVTKRILARSAMDLSHIVAIGIPLVPTRQASAILHWPGDKDLSTVSASTSVKVVPSDQRVSGIPDGMKTTEKASTTAVTTNGTNSTAVTATEKVFMTDTFLFKLDGCELCEAKIAAETPKDAPEGHVKLSVVLNRTVFHPQGGGQPADFGTLNAKGLPELRVSFVSLRREDGAVIHDCVTEKAHADAWARCIGTKQVSCWVDEERRRLCARLHSAGHLLDAAVTAANFKWVPGKGYHFPDGPYVEYILKEDSFRIDPKKAGEKDALIKKIQDNIKSLVEAGGPVTVQMKEGVRHVMMAGEECPCGGTHVADIAQIGPVNVKNAQNKQGNIRISYNLPAAA